MLPAVSRERPAIAAMHGYTPGKQPDAPSVVKLNTNENPYPPCEAVLDVLRAIPADALRRYPSPTSSSLRDTIAHLHGTDADHVIAVNGGDELLRLVITTFVEPGAAVGALDPGYSLVPVLAQIHGSPLVRVPCAADWSWPHDLAARMNDAGARVLFVVNPHAPSGRLTPAAEVLAVARAFDGVLLVDEAYVDFVDPAHGHDFLPLALREENVLVLRTFSKGYSLAGLRAGYGVGHADLIAPLMKTRDSYNLDAIAQRIAQAAIEHRASAADTWQRVRAERQRVTSRLAQLGCDIAPSETNFLLARMPATRAASDAQRALEARGVLVRWFDDPRLSDCLRITIGTPPENDRLLAELQRWLGV
jgi:histidinol-phosphate aminotransferase